MATERVEQLRKDIDSGRTGDKVAIGDPASVPLGADDEAAGVPPSPEMVALARRMENTTSGEARGLAAGASNTITIGPVTRSRTGWVIIGFAVLVVVLVAAALYIG